MSYLTLIVIVSLFCNTMFNIVIGTGRPSMGRRETRTNFPEDPTERKARRDYVFLSETDGLREPGVGVEEPDDEDEDKEREDGSRKFSKFRKVLFGTYNQDII